MESVLALDAGFWFEFADPEAPQRVQAGQLRPDWNKRGFLVARYRTLLENLITAEIGTDTRAWVTERPRLLGWPT